MKNTVSLKRNLSSLESPMKNAFCFTLKALFVLKILNIIFSPDSFDHVGKRLSGKAKVNFKIYDVIYCETNNCSTQVDQYLNK